MNRSLTSLAGDLLRQGLAPSGPSIGPATARAELRPRDSECLEAALGQLTFDKVFDRTLDIAARSLEFPAPAFDTLMASRDVLDYQGDAHAIERLEQASVLAEIILSSNPATRPYAIGAELARAGLDFARNVSECEDERDRRTIERVYESRAPEATAQPPSRLGTSGRDHR